MRDLFSVDAGASGKPHAELAIYSMCPNDEIPFMHAVTRAGMVLVKDGATWRMLSPFERACWEAGHLAYSLATIRQPGEIRQPYCKGCGEIGGCDCE